jgi:uncharacterized protein (TIGR02246 family)
MHGNTAPDSTDEAAVHDVYRRLMEGWNQNSGAAFAAVFTDDGDLVGFDGQHLKGRAQIASFHQHEDPTHEREGAPIPGVDALRLAVEGVSAKPEADV